MIARITPCDRDLLRHALHAELDTVHQQRLESHLTTCDLCRDELERLAGGAGWMSEVREHLTSVEVEPYRESDRIQPAVAVGGGLNGNEPHDDEPDRTLNFLEPSADLEKLGRLGHYEIESVIGRGGMGIVLKAFDPTLNRHVAIKVLAAELATSGAARRRFARESQAAAAIAHEHVVAIHAVDNSGKLPFLVMPYIPGKSLQERLDESGPLDVKEVLRIGLQAAAGLAAAHAQGLVHRDIKPANILLENGIERVRITDFGLARAVDDASQTQSGFIAGTPQYMAPEQARGEPVDHRADLFSLGSVMYAMCSGRPPFRAETTFAVLRRICEETPRPLREVNPDIPDWLQAIIGKLHARDPIERFQTAAEVASLLEQYLAHVQQPTTYPLPKFFPAKRPRGLVLSRLQGRLVLWSGTGLLLAGLIVGYRASVELPAAAIGTVRSLTPSPSVSAVAGTGAPAMGMGMSPGGQASPSGPGMFHAPAARIDPWQQWEAALVEVGNDLRQIELQEAPRVSVGGPIDHRDELLDAKRQLEAVEAELNPGPAQGRSK